MTAWQGILESSEEKWHLGKTLNTMRKLVMCTPGEGSSRLRNSKCKGPGAGAGASLLEEQQSTPCGWEKVRQELTGIRPMRQGCLAEFSEMMKMLGFCAIHCERHQPSGS